MVFGFVDAILAKKRQRHTRPSNDRTRIWRGCKPSTTATSTLTIDTHITPQTAKGAVDLTFEWARAFDIESANQCSNSLQRLPTELEHLSSSSGHHALNLSLPLRAAHATQSREQPHISACTIYDPTHATENTSKRMCAVCADRSFVFPLHATHFDTHPAFISPRRT